MTELLDAILSWRLFLVVILVYGLMPGLVLRPLVKIYPREDPRRTELIATLYTVPRFDRPFWVAEQIETALFDGLPSRIAARRAGSYASRRLRRAGQATRDCIARELDGTSEHWITSGFLEARHMPKLHRGIIVGGPGSGKTTAAKALASKAISEQWGSWLPLVVSAGRWDPQGESLGGFLTSELVRRYNLPVATARELVDAHPRLLIILDGLDEIPGEARARASCEIRAYAHSPLVATARPGAAPGLMDGLSVVPGDELQISMRLRN